MEERRPRFPNKFAIMGVFFILAGIVLLLWTAGYLQQFVALWPLLPVIGGLILLYFRVFRDGPDYYIFLGSSFLLVGILVLLITTVLPVGLDHVWPSFMTVIGVSLLLYGLRKQGGSRISFTVPGGAMILLSLFFLPFSLDVVSVDFAAFVSVWWPALLVIMGFALILAHAGRGRDEE